MAISENATEFAGLPIIEYQPAVGLVLTTMPRRAFRSGDKDFWAIMLDRDRLVTQSGKPDTAGKSKTKTFPKPEAARAEYRKLIAEKIEAGYTELKQAGTTTRDALVAALVADPDDTTSRMAFADYLSEHGEQLPAEAYRVGQERWDDDINPRLEAFLAEPAVGLVQALVIGMWGQDSDNSPDEVVEAIINARDRLTNLRALFLGDIPYSDNEISWIVQTDLTPLLKAFPKLEHFRARGGNELVLKKFKHDNLKSLVFEASNLPREVVRAVGASDLPALEHLELWLGTEEYGANTEVADLKGILQGKSLPALRYLGLRNSEITDRIAGALLKAQVMERVRVLDLSLGTLSDKGAWGLLTIPSLAKLEKLDIHHHYVSPALVERLRAVGIEVDASDVKEAEDYGDEEEAHRYVAHAE